MEGVRREVTAQHEVNAGVCSLAKNSTISQRLLNIKVVHSVEKRMELELTASKRRREPVSCFPVTNFNFNFISLLCSFKELSQRNQGDRTRAFSSPFILPDSPRDAPGRRAIARLPLAAATGSAAPPSTQDCRPPRH